MEPKDPTPEEQLAARIWERYKTDKRYPYVQYGMKLWKLGHRNIGQILEALAYLASLQNVREPWSVVMSAPVLSRALSKDMEARATEAARVDKGPQLVGDILGNLVATLQDKAAESAERNAKRPVDGPEAA